MDPKFQQLRAFYYTYRLRSLTRAGEQLHLTQSAMSRLLQQLESVLGLRLFDRAAGTLHPTEAAEEAIAIIERVIGDVEYLKNSLKGLAQQRRGHVKFSIIPSLAAHVMPEILLRFRERWVNVEVEMLDAHPARVVELVLNEAVQFGISTIGQRLTDLEYDLLADDHLCVICRRDSALARKAHLTWQDLTGLDVIATSGGPGWPDIVHRILAQQDRPIVPRYTVAFSFTALAMAAQGLGVTVLPTHMVGGSPYEQGLVARILKEPVVPHGWYVVTRARRSISPAGLALIASVKEAMSSHASAVADDPDPRRR